MAEGSVIRIGTGGEVTLPETLRESLGLQPGAEVSVEQQDQTLVIRRIDTRSPTQNWLDRLWGSADTGMTTDEIMALTRGEG